MSSLEHPLLRAPSESLASLVRTVQRVTTRETTAIVEQVKACRAVKSPQVRCDSVAAGVLTPAPPGRESHSGEAGQVDPRPEAQGTRLSLAPIEWSSKANHLPCVPTTQL